MFLRAQNSLLWLHSLLWLYQEDGLEMFQVSDTGEGTAVIFQVELPMDGLEMTDH